MDSHKLALPLLAFAGGAILGRLFGLKTLMRGAMTAAAFTGVTSAQPALIGPATHRTNGAHRRKPTRARRSAAKRSASA
jgi:hypothetical protein